MWGKWGQHTYTREKTKNTHLSLVSAVLEMNYISYLDMRLKKWLDFTVVADRIQKSLNNSSNFFTLENNLLNKKFLQISREF